MSSVSKYSNGDKVIDECPFCGGKFEEPQALGDKIHCNEEQGGCGNKYRLSMVSNVIRSKQEEK